MAGGSVVGLDVGSSTIKVAELKKSGNGLEVTALGMTPTPQDAFENSVIVDPQMLGQAIKSLLKEAGITAKHCISSVSGQSGAVVRVIDVPQMDLGELDETMKWEAERHVPFSINDTVMDYLPIERPEELVEGQNMDVLLAVAQMDMIDRHIAMLQAAGLKPDAIDVEPLAIGRTFLQMAGDQPAGHTVVIVNIGASVTDIGIFRDKLPTLLRSLPLAGENLTRAIADNLMIDTEHAEAYKKEVAEVLFDQLAQPTSDFGGSGGFGGGGFIDFTAPAPPAPDLGMAQPLSGSGRMPFDFSTPNEAAPPAGPTPFDFTTEAANRAPSGSLDPGSGSLSGTLDPAFSELPSGSGSLSGSGSGSGSISGSLSGSLESEPGFFTPDYSAAPPPPGGALTVPSTQSTGDPQRDALRLQVFNAIAPVLAELVQELRRSLDFHQAKAVDPQIHEVLLAGGSSRLKNLAQYIESELGIPTRIADPLENVRVSTKNFSPEHLAEIAPVFPISIGLGAYNLLGGAARRPKPKRKKAPKAAATAAS